MRGNPVMVLVACAGVGSAWNCAGPSMPPSPPPVVALPPVDAGATGLASAEASPALASSQAIDAPVDPCKGGCDGKATQDLALALQQKAGEARRCYNTALSTDPRVEGKVLLAVRVAPDGSVCSSVLIQSEMPGDMNACLEELFAHATFPGPTGGCVDARVPMLFKPVSADAGP